MDHFNYVILLKRINEENNYFIVNQKGNFKNY
jgi:hypothetical protein